jgi:hypothetical protein
LAAAHRGRVLQEVEVQGAFQVGAVQAGRKEGLLVAAWSQSSQVGDSPDILRLKDVQDVVEVDTGTLGRQAVVPLLEDTANVEDAWNAAGCDPPNLLEGLHTAACVEVSFRRVGHMAGAGLGTLEEMACFGGRIGTCPSGDR